MAGRRLEIDLEVAGSTLTVLFVPKGGGSSFASTAEFAASYRGGNLTGDQHESVMSLVTAVRDVEAHADLDDVATIGDVDVVELLPRLFGFAQVDRAALPDQHELEILLRLTRRCNQACPFCSAPPCIEPSLEDVERCLSWVDRFLPGSRVTLTGGEPTLVPWFNDVLRVALEKDNIRDVLVQTNAVAFSRPPLIERLPRQPRLSFFVSLHALDEAIYDRVTQTTGQLPIALDGIRNLLDRGFLMTLNIVVCRDNLDHLSSFVTELSSALLPRPVPVLHISTLICTPGNSEVVEQLVPFSTLSPAVEGAVRLAEDLGLTVEPLVSSTHASMPLCLVSDAAKRQATRRPRIESRETGFELDGGTPWVKAPQCRSCVVESQCLGVPALYALRYGFAELVAIEGPSAVPE